MADSPVRVTENHEEHDHHSFQEVHVHTDEQITNPNDPRAVQVPEDTGASTAGHEAPLGSAFERGVPEEQFEQEAEQSAPEYEPEQEHQEHTSES